MKASEKAYSLIKKFSPLRTRFYICKRGYYAIGYEHIDGVDRGMEITEEQAEKFLQTDVRLVENSIINRVNKPLLQNQFDALVSFIHSIGYKEFKNTHLLSLLNQNTYSSSILVELSKYIYDSARNIDKNLIERRNAEKTLYFSHIS